MKQKFSDRSVLKILASLKTIESRYPARMMRSRRQRYIRQIEAATAKTAAQPKRSSR